MNQDVYHDGGLLVLNVRRCELPAICLKTGVRTEDVLRLDGEALTQLKSICPGLQPRVMGSVVPARDWGQPITVSLPLSKDWRDAAARRVSAWWTATRVAGAALVVSLPLCCFGDAFAMPMLASFVALMACLVMMFVMSGKESAPFVVARIRGEWIWLKGVAPEVAGSFPRIPREVLEAPRSRADAEDVPWGFAFAMAGLSMMIMVVMSVLRGVAQHHSAGLLVFPLLATTAIAWWGAARLLAEEKQVVTIVFAFNAGHFLWLVIAGAFALARNNDPNAADLALYSPLDLVCYLIGLPWLVRKPGTAPLCFLGVYQVLALWLDATALANAAAGGLVFKGLLIQLFWRVGALFAIVAVLVALSFHLRRRRDLLQIERDQHRRSFIR